MGLWTAWLEAWHGWPCMACLPVCCLPACGWMLACLPVFACATATLCHCHLHRLPSLLLSSLLSFYASQLGSPVEVAPTSPAAAVNCGRAPCTTELRQAQATSDLVLPLPVRPSNRWCSPLFFH